MPSDDPDLGTGYYEVVQRTFKVEDSAFAGQTVQQFEDAAKTAGRRRLPRHQRRPELRRRPEEGPYAVSNVLLTIWGSVIVLLNH